MTNLHRAFADLFPAPALLVGTVDSVSGNQVLLTLPGGAQVQARGTATVGATVFIRNGVVEAVAPSLPIVSVTI